MHQKYCVEKFDYKKFLDDHWGDVVVFVTGSWVYTSHTGSYSYWVKYQNQWTSWKKELKDLKSPNVAMLLAVEHICRKLKHNDIDVYIVSPTELGFKRGERNKGANVALVQEIYTICKDKNLRLHSATVVGGGEFLKCWIERRLRKK